MKLSKPQQRGEVPPHGFQLGKEEQVQVTPHRLLHTAAVSGLETTDLALWGPWALPAPPFQQAASARCWEGDMEGASEGEDGKEQTKKGERG